MTHQYPRLRTPYVERRNLFAHYPEIRKVTVEAVPVRPGGINRSDGRRYALLSWLRAWISQIDILLGCGRWNDAAARKQAREARNLGPKSNTRKPIYISIPKMSIIERVAYVVLLVVSVPTLLHGWERPPKIPRNPFPWITYRILSCLLEIYVLPVRIRTRLFGPILIDPEARPSVGRRWVPGIAFMPIAGMPVEAFATRAETTTTTADPGAAGTTLNLTTRTPFNQNAVKQMYLMIQDTKTDDTRYEVVLVTGAFGTGAGSVTMVRNQEGTSGAGGHPIGSYVAAIVTATGLKNAKLNALGFVNLQDQFDAVGDFTADDTTPMQNASNFLPTTGGTILAGPTSNAYKISSSVSFSTANPVSLTYETPVRIIGAGMGATVFKRSADVVIFEANGTIATGTVTMRRGVSLSDLTLDGNATGTSALMRCIYNYDSRYDRCIFRNGNGPLIIGVQYWDSYYDNCWITLARGTTLSLDPGWNSGTAIMGQEAVRLTSVLASGLANTQLGYSTDNVNNIWFTNVNFTENSAGSIYAGQMGGTSQPNKLYCVNNKYETTGSAAGPHVRFYSVTRSNYVNANFLVNGLAAGLGSVDSMNFSNGTSITLEGLFFEQGGAGYTTARAMLIAGGCDRIFIDAIESGLNGGGLGTVPTGVTTSVYGQYTTASGNYGNPVAIEFAGSPTKIYLGGIEQSGTAGKFRGTAGLQRYTQVSIRTSTDQLLAGTGTQSVTGLSFPISANETWIIRCTLFTNNTASDVGGCKVAINGPAGCTVKMKCYGPSTAVSAFTSAILTALNTLSAVAFGTVATTPAWIEMEGTATNGSTAGTIQIQAAEGTAADDITIQANSELTASQV